MTKREGVPACEPAGESWWCRLKERIDYLWDRASACILTVNHKTPDGDGDFSISGGDGITVTDEDNGVRIAATITDETVEGIVGQEAAAREAADKQLGQQISSEAAAREAADKQLGQQISSEAAARQQADQGLQADINTRATQAALDNEAAARQQAVTAEARAREQADDALRADKLDRDQGTGNAGKVLLVGGDGIVKPGTSSASVAWGGISGELADQTDLSDALDGKADDADVVHKSGAETVGGAKTLTSNPTIAKSNPYMILKATDVSADNPPTSWTRIGTHSFTDSNNKSLAGIYAGHLDGVTNVEIYAATLRAGELVSGGLRIYATQKTIYAACPDIPGTSTSQEIVNARSLSKWPSIVRTVGNQSIAGVKTFTQTLQAPTPGASAAGTEVVTAAWVRARIDELQKPSIEVLAYHGDSGTNTIRLDNVEAGDMMSFDMGVAGSWVIPMLIVPTLNPGDNYVLPNTGSQSATLRLRRDSTGYYLESGLPGVYSSKITGSRIRLGNTITEATV